MKTEVAVKVMQGFLQRSRGLQFRREDEKNYCFKNCNCIHTFGMKKPIDAAFVSVNGAVLQVVKGVRPRRVLRNKHASVTIERFSSGQEWLEEGAEYTFKEER